MRIGRLFGIEIALDLSVLLVVVLVLLSLGLGVLPVWHPAWGPVLDWGIAAAAALLFVASVLAHEISHALVARAQGIPIAGITLFVFGGVTRMEDEPHTPRAELLVAIVGPLTSLVIGIAALYGGSFLAREAIQANIDDPTAALRAASPGATLLLWLGPINVMLGLFNLVPGFPLDGGRVLRAALWWGTGSLMRATRMASLGGQAFAWLLMGAGLAMAFGVYLPYFGGGPAQGLWLLLIGWFLNNAARASYEQLVVRESLADVHVSDVMRAHPRVVPPDISLRQFVVEFALDSEQQTFPVADGDALLGVVDLRAVRRIAEAEWGGTRVRDVMVPAGDLPVVSPRDEAMAALRNLASREVDQIPVVEDGHLRGVVRQQDIMRWLYLHGGRAPA
jgi:Zn-dependent protease/predicted transcriptional regulator